MFTHSINPYSILFLGAAFVDVFLIIYLARKKYKSWSVYTLIMLLVLTCETAFSQFFLSNAYTQSYFAFWFKIMMVADYLIPPMYLTFTICYLGKTWVIKKAWFILLTIVPFFIILYLGWTTTLLYTFSISGTHITPWGYPFQEGPYDTFIPIHEFSYFLLSFGLLAFHYFRTPDKLKRKKTFVILSSLLFLIFGVLLFYGVLPGALDMSIFPAAPLIETVVFFFTTLSIASYGSWFLSPLMLAPIVFETMNEGVVGIDADYKIQFINNGGNNLLHYSSKSLPQIELRNLFANAIDFNKVKENILKPLASQSVTSIDEVEMLTTDQHVVPVTISGTKVLDDNKQILGYILIFTDISRIKEYYMRLEDKVKEIQEKNTRLEELHQALQLEKESVERKVDDRTKDLHAEHARLQSSINSISLGFLMTDKERNILMLNKAIYNIFNTFLPGESILLSKVQSLLPSTIDIAAGVDHAITKKELVALSDIAVGKKYVNIFISPIIPVSTSVSEVIGTVILIEDKTEEYLLQRSKEEFMSIASHELRTPLTAIRGYTSLINEYYSDKIQGDEVKLMITNIGVSSERLIKMVNNFLDATSLEQGKINIQTSQCDLIAIIKSSINEVEPLALSRKLYVKFETLSDKALVIADEGKLKQVVINIITNGIKFTENGGVLVKLLQESNTTYKILVQDSGKGISEINKNLLFRKFQQAVENIYTREEGTGLGLYISRLLMERMGGKVQLEQSELGKGSTFSITLPRAV